MRRLFDSELGFYFSSVFTLIFWEVRRNDFPVMFAHHLVTVALLASAMRAGFWRAGCLVMALHDACDVLMELAKALNYARCDAAATLTFAAFMVAWAALRLAFYPMHVVRSAVWELPDYLGGGRRGMWAGFCAGLGVLLCLHVYWFTLIVRVAWLKVATGDGRDVREEDEDED